MKQEKIIESIASAVNHLEGSMKALAKKDEKNLVNLVWRAGADLEYALFLFSLMHQNESESSSWKIDSHSKQVEISSILSSVQNLLREAKDNMKAGELFDAHKKTWTARGYLLRVHDTFEKKRKEQRRVK
ncbi:hypothetical protein E3I90_04965 [Candidatus Bathyarchaeota archaeon]|nr:MAG: hypothetical protein E3I90_04965 [Candidatus Bathyarchaeota archaeon]